jgi:hypothetical protein
MIRKLLVLCIVIGAVAAPAALAKPVSSDGSDGGYDPWAYSLIYQSRHPSTNLGPLDPWAYSLVHKTAATPAVTTNSSSGFDFGDAGIGAAAAFSLAVILLGTMVVGLRYRRINRSRLAVS